jgi:replicative DNA helicase
VTEQGQLEQVERALIGGLLFNNSHLERIRDQVESGMFYLPQHNAIYDAICELADQGKPADAVTVGSLLQEQGRLKQLGGAMIFDGLTNYIGWNVALDVRLDRYCAMIREQHLRREMTRAGQIIADRGERLQDGVQSYLDESLSLVGGIAEKEIRASVAASSMAETTKETYEAIVRQEDPPGMVPSGILTFDSRYRGLYACYTIVGGYPGMGKTTLADNLAANAALAGRKALYFSMEDSRHVIACRMLGRFGKINTQNLIQHKITKAEQALLIGAAEKVHQLPIIIIDQGGMTGDQIRRTAQRYFREGKADLVLVDNLQKIREKGKDLYEITTRASGEMVDMQKALGVPVIALCQLRRPEKQKEVRMPTLGDLRGSGMIEADARRVILLHRPHYYFETGVITEEPDENEIAAIVAKNNYGITGPLRLYIDRLHGYIGDNPDIVQESLDPTGERY